jgi:predicted DNA-binding antitoxin AbrB/MazE fold protein
MSTVHAIYENGVFRPLESVDLPNQCHVEFEPRLVNGTPKELNIDTIYAVRSKRFDCGETDGAELDTEAGEAPTFPLRGIPAHLELPFEPVAAEEWEAAQ